MIYVWEGNPGLVRINNKSAAVNGRLITTSAYRTNKARMSTAFRETHGGQPPVNGQLHVRGRMYWPRMNRQGAASGIALGDIDAPVKAGLDALKEAGVIVDDAQVVAISITKHYDKDRPRIELEVRPWEVE